MHCRFLSLWFFLITLTAAGKSKPFPVRALYLSDNVLKDSAKVAHFIELAKHSTVNSYVVDVKGVEGTLRYKSAIPVVQNTHAYTEEYDLDKILKQFHRNHIHVIARIVCFNDPYMAAKKPEWAVKRTYGSVYKAPISGGWLNPANKESWKYITDIAKECTAKGFDEIQFDYVRFPTDGDVKELDFGQPVPVRHLVIDSFLAYARQQMPRTVLSADVFAIICESIDDPEKIGQTLETVGKNLDYISPMMYPALYACPSWINHESIPLPNMDPYKIIYNSITGAKDRIAKVQGYRAKIRPFMQGYSAQWLKPENYQPYGTEQIKQQIKAANDAGCDQWIFWNEDGVYPEDGFK